MNTPAEVRSRGSRAARALVVTTALSVGVVATGCVEKAYIHCDRAMEVAARAARYELECREVRAELVSTLLVPASWGKRATAEFKVGVEGCGKADVMAVSCGFEEDSGCDIESAERVKSKKIGE